MNYQTINAPSARLGHGDYHYEVDTKFFLLRILCNSELESTSGAVVHKDEARNLWTEALIESQKQLLQTGFQSMYYKLDGLCKANADILDGRNDLHEKEFDGPEGGTPFDPPERRYEDEGRFSSAVVRIKTQVIGELRAVAKLREQYRLGQLLSLFKQKLTSGGAG